jgi:hypothetical protein
MSRETSDARRMADEVAATVQATMPPGGLTDLVLTLAYAVDRLCNECEALQRTLDSRTAHLV